MRRLALASAALLLLLPMTGIATLATAPAQAGGTTVDGYLEAAIYNDSPFDFKYVAGYTQSSYGWKEIPERVLSEDAGYFAVYGNGVSKSGVFCSQYENTYNTWFTFETDLTGGLSEFVTISIHGQRKVGYGDIPCSVSEHPAIDVWQTSTKPPSTWRWTDGAPPNLIAKPLFSYQRNVPYLYDQTFHWVGEGPGMGVPTIVSLGDSMTSGEGGRWAGNTNVSNGRDDAGSTS